MLPVKPRGESLKMTGIGGKGLLPRNVRGGEGLPCAPL